MLFYCFRFLKRLQGLDKDSFGVYIPKLKNKVRLRPKHAVLSQNKVLCVHKYRQAGVLFTPY